MTDLAAKSLGEGKVRLTWTSPGDDGVEGTAAWYQVKYSAARLVERVRGWPAENLDGEPAPAAAGTSQSFAVTGLSPGVHYFALKTWGHGPNVSDLSNVVQADVK